MERWGVSWVDIRSCWIGRGGDSIERNEIRWDLEKAGKGWSKFHKASESTREKKTRNMFHGKGRLEVGLCNGLEKKRG